MKGKPTEASDPCVQTLKETLTSTPQLSINDERRVKKALRWQQDNRAPKPTLAEYMGVLRISTDVAVTIRLADGEERYLQYDAPRETVVVGQRAGSELVPIETTTVGTKYVQESISLVPQTSDRDE